MEATDEFEGIDELMLRHQTLQATEADLLQQYTTGIASLEDAR